MKNQRTKLLRWSLLLQEFNFTITHCRGAHNELPDALSRHPQSTEVVKPDLDRALPQVPPMRLNMIHPHLLPDMVKQAQRDRGEYFAQLIARFGQPHEALVRAEYHVEDGILYRNDPQGCLALMVPEELHTKVTRTSHAHYTTGHPGAAKTLRAIQERY